MHINSNKWKHKWQKKLVLKYLKFFCNQIVILAVTIHSPKIIRHVACACYMFFLGLKHEKTYEHAAVATLKFIIDCEMYQKNE